MDSLLVWNPPEFPKDAEGKLPDDAGPGAVPESVVGYISCP